MSSILKLLQSGLFLTLVVCAVTSFSQAQPQSPKNSLKSNGKMGFDSQLVEGQIYRPELSVVTGDTVLEGRGLIRVRTQLDDQINFEYMGKPK
jgi:hypothetical protein